MNEDVFEFLETHDIDETDILLELSSISDETASYEVPFSRLTLSFYNISKPEDFLIGAASFYLINTKRHKETEIRVAADMLEFPLYQAVSSVRFFPNPLELQKHTYNEQEKHLTDETRLSYISQLSALNTPLTGKPGTEILTFEKNPTSPQTASVYGKVLVLDEFYFKQEYNKHVFTQYLADKMSNYLREIGLFDFLIVNPNYERNYLIANDYPATDFTSYVAFWNQLKPKTSKGKLHNNDYCFVFDLDS